MLIEVQFVPKPENTVCVFNGGASVFVVDDSCYVLKNLVNGEFKSSPYIFGEALEVLLGLPENPRDALDKSTPPANESPKVTVDDIEDNIVSEHYFTALDGVAGSYGGLPDPYPDELGLLTFCVMVLRNGFTVTGESACVSPDNFDEQIGRSIARQNAIQKIWPLMGYALKTSLMRCSCGANEACSNPNCQGGAK